MGVRTNKAVLDDAARSVRRTFLGSIAGTLGMMGVVGAAGAYGMPERLNAQSLSQAFASLQVKFSTRIERAGVERGYALASGTARLRTATMPAPDDTIMPVPLPQLQSQDLTVVADVAPAAAPAKTEVGPASAAATAGRFESKAILMQGAGSTRGPSADAYRAYAALTPPMAPLPMDAPRASEETERTSAPQAATASAPEANPDVKPAAAPEAAIADVPNSIDGPKKVWVVLPPPKMPLTPAQRLGLRGSDYDKAERCLAQAVYFEARNEPVRGQMAVAQVVLNRVFSPYYPNDVCSVVYQNAHRRLSCQFTFACDGKSGAIRERGAWARAQRIARQALAAEIWLPEIAKATHYHAAYVRPYWVREMNVMARFGLHTFYRPRMWGDGHNEPSWGAGGVKTGVHQFYRPYNWGDGSNEPGWGTPTKTAAKTTKLN